MEIKLLDCTLRDGAYIVDARFGSPAIRGIIKRLQDANVDLIECGWLKDMEYEQGTTYYHTPKDLRPYIANKDADATYVAMIDWDRYDLRQLPDNDGRSVDAIRVVFPYAHFRDGIGLCPKIKDKGYQVYLQAANTLSYNEKDLMLLAKLVNEAGPEALSVVDTFGAMCFEDLERIIDILDTSLDPQIGLGFHSHNNQQLSFALCMKFAERLKNSGRNVIIDGSLCGMGRGAGNAPTELVANFLNKKYHGNYDMNMIMDTIDIYMTYFQQHYNWGYSIPYFIAGMYCTHVNNIAYLLDNHGTGALDMRNVIESLDAPDRMKYDYGLLEQKYIDYQSNKVDDSQTLERLKKEWKNRELLLLLPGKSVFREIEKIQSYIAEKQPVVVGINAVFPGYDYQWLFFTKQIRYDYGKEAYGEIVSKASVIVTSNIREGLTEDTLLVNYSFLVKRGWLHFDNACIMFLRLLNRVHVQRVAVAGFDGFENDYGESYADTSLPYINPEESWDDLNSEIRDMFQDFKVSVKSRMDIHFLTESKYEG